MAYMPFKVTVERSDGEVLELGDGSEWVVAMNSMKGFTSQISTVNTEKNVLTDGSIVVNRRVEERDRTFSAVYYGTERIEARQTVTRFFNPKHHFVVHVTYHGRTRWCSGEQKAFDCAVALENTPVKFTWTIICPSPWMNDEDRNSSAFGDATAAFGFPYVSHVREATEYGRKPVGVMFGRLLYDGLNTVYNSGDVPTYFKAVMSANGHIENPELHKDGKAIKYLGTLEDGDVLEIDFEAAPPTVELNGQNVIQRCSRDSNFTGMIMQLGANVFTVEVGNKDNRSLLETRILFNRKFTGV